MVYTSLMSRVFWIDADGSLSAWGRRGERRKHDCSVQTDRLSGGSVIVWGGIIYSNPVPVVEV